MESSQKIEKNRASDAEKTMATQEGNDSFYHNTLRNWKKKRFSATLK
jgi:hypothetical protein